ncbi:broad-specificity cellobiase [Hydrogenispora ethanolica]|uniref:Beta-glucosidase n=1 Tax=Hydrogenispora ethanolica TaxID=1082276 RepID=A0A4R1RZV0_HYDET|nr:GH1 family beta-glucosidase [Hydrogenispora ethanolica]TCL72326.1 broad-specificity cellobiase [Hydrogenispora ethanolica]
MPKHVFPVDFVWGAATAAYQIEGAVREDGRGESIWDRFSHTPGKIQGGDTGDVACDHYHRYREDVALMREMGLKGYRFSIAWPRIVPAGKGALNPKGLDFYNALVDRLLANGITPYATLYHWELPQLLQDRGGWDNRDTAAYFAEYAAVVFESLGDRVRHWITLNEPSVVAYNGHAIGEHAPGFTDYALAVRVSHHLNLAHARAVAAYRQLNQGGVIGTTLNLTSVYPAGNAPEDGAAARIADGMYNRWFLDPVLKGAYPRDILELFGQKLQAPVIQAGDLERIAAAPIDFLGLNYYSRLLVRSAPSSPFGYEAVRGAGPCTAMGWEIYPDGLYDLLVRLDRDYGHPRLLVTENGAAFDDPLQAGRVADPERIAYLREHFLAARRAIESGVRLEGYFVWSLLDNFEWAHGYSRRFGLIYVDYPTQERIWKDSARWYQGVIRQNGV